MEIIKLSDIIGQEISEVCYRYTPETDEQYSVQSSYTYIKLANNQIIGIPHFDDDDFIHLTDENMSYYQNNFDFGMSIPDESKRFLIGQKIVDFFFSYYNNEPDFDQSAFIQLSNGYYLTERSHAPMGIYVGYYIFTEQEFLNEKDRLIKLKVEVRSFLESSYGKRIP